jgi:hypothetical protein
MAQFKSLKKRKFIFVYPMFTLKMQKALKLNSIKAFIFYQ